MKGQHILWITLLCLAVLAMTGCPPSDSDSERNLDLVSVSGTVTDVNSAPVEGAVVTITSEPVTDTTDSQGAFVALVVAGSHSITITMASAEIYRASFTCSADTPMDLGEIETSYDPTREVGDGDDDGYSENQGDCDDADPDVNPGADEVCDDDRDNDCDGDTDCEDGDCAADPTCEQDNDGDGYSGTEGDCDDGDPDIHPGVDEVCDDSRDNDCDGDTDCEDGDCASDPACGQDGTSLLWVQSYDPEVPISRWEYAGGAAVRMIFYQDFRATGASGSLQLGAAVKEEATDTTNLAQHSTDVTVQAGQTYTLITEVNVSSWGSCSPNDWDTIVFSSPTTSVTGSINIYPVFDTDWNGYECVGRYAISAMRIEACEGAIGSPVAGHWTGTAGFGQVEYRMASDGTAIERVKLEFQSFSCGNVVDRSGSITITNEAGWPVTDDEFSILLTLSHTLDQEMRLQGRFANAGTTASGTYTADFNDSLCEGTWNAAPGRE